MGSTPANTRAGLYTDESPGLKVDPVVVLVLSLVFIFSVVALHSKPSFPFASFPWGYLFLPSVFLSDEFRAWVPSLGLAARERVI